MKLHHAHVVRLETRDKNLEGQGAYTIEFSHYAPVPPQTQQTLASQFKLEKEEDSATA